MGRGSAAAADHLDARLGGDYRRPADRTPGIVLNGTLFDGEYRQKQAAWMAWPTRSKSGSERWLCGGEAAFGAKAPGEASILAGPEDRRPKSRG
jgi:hypothetical protein